MDPPPKMYEIGTLEGALEIVLSGFSTSSNFFGVEFGVAFNVLTTGLFRIQQSSHASASTLCLPEHQVKLAEQGVDQDRTKDARPCSTDTIRLSIVCPSLWRKSEAANFPHTLKI